MALIVSYFRKIANKNLFAAWPAYKTEIRRCFTINGIPNGERQRLGAPLVFNMERGVHLEELGDFLESCPEVRPFDVILANELDNGRVRSGQRDAARALAERHELCVWPGVH